MRETNIFGKQKGRFNEDEATNNSLKAPERFLSSFLSMEPSLKEESLSIFNDFHSHEGVKDKYRSVKC